MAHVSARLKAQALSRSELIENQRKAFAEARKAALAERAELRSKQEAVKAQALKEIAEYQRIRYGKSETVSSHVKDGVGVVHTIYGRGIAEASELQSGKAWVSFHGFGASAKKVGNPITVLRDELTLSR